MSDFSLMDAIECGIVKLPRVPVADNFLGRRDADVSKSLGDTSGQECRKKGAAKRRRSILLACPPQLQTALEALYGHYKKTFKLWEDFGIKVPPCFIVVCNNTSTSKLVYDFISGFHRQNEDGSTTLENGRLRSFSKFR